MDAAELSEGAWVTVDAGPFIDLMENHPTSNDISTDVGTHSPI